MPNPPGLSRAEQTQHTRDEILSAVVALIEEQGEFTIADVAARSSVSPATIYRHFPNRTALVEAVAREDTFMGTAAPTTIAEWRDLMIAVWKWHDENYDRIVAVSSTPVGREMRAARMSERQPRLVDLLASSGIDVQTPAGQRLVTLAMLLPSSRTFLDVREVFDLETETAVEMVTWAVTALIRATREGWEIGDGLE
jgi:AcrR family transcriptional regulator